MVSYNFAIHATCLLAFTTYKYGELQVSNATQKLNCKANCKTPFFFMVNFDCCETNWNNRRLLWKLKILPNNLPIHTTITKLKEQMLKNKVIEVTNDENQL
jgi:hypothetical protein